MKKTKIVKIKSIPMLATQYHRYANSNARNLKGWWRTYWMSLSEKSKQKVRTHYIDKIVLYSEVAKNDRKSKRL